MRRSTHRRRSASPWRLRLCLLAVLVVLLPMTRVYGCVRCLGVRNQATTSPAVTQIYTCHGQTNQKWTTQQSGPDTQKSTTPAAPGSAT